MILRPLEPPAPATREFLPAWEVVEHTQTQMDESCWMITQPSHAALAGELAAKLSAPQFPPADATLARVIALHDAGWGIPDAQTIMLSRSLQHRRPQSFIALGVTQFVEAWEKSIETAESVSPAGGYIVSRHFWRLAEHRVHSAAGKSDRQKLESFLKKEERRRDKLAARQSLAIEQLEQLTDLLQFCDLLSLYICCGARQNVIFPDYFGIRLGVAHEDESYQLDPKIIKSGTTLSVAALRFPATKAESSREMEIRIG